MNNALDELYTLEQHCNQAFYQMWQHSKDTTKVIKYKKKKLNKTLIVH